MRGLVVKRINKVGDPDHGGEALVGGARAARVDRLARGGDVAPRRPAGDGVPAE